jgi:uncharacterized protein YggE
MTLANHHRRMRAAVATGLLLFGAAGALAAGSEPHTVAVSGTATVQAAPDLAYLNMSIVERNSSVTAAQTAAATVTNRVLNLLEQLGVARPQINTTGAQIRPDYRWDRERERQELLGYVVERSITVELRELDLLGRVIEQVSAAGVNQLAPPQLDSSRKRELYREALALAVKDARASAEVIAAAAGGTLGAALSIGTGQAAPPPRPMLRMQADVAMAAESIPESFTPGELSYSASVTAIYELQE